MVGHQRYNERQTHCNEYGYYPRERRVQDNALGKQNKNNVPGLSIHTNHCSVTVIKVFLPYPIGSYLLKLRKTSVTSASARTFSGQKRILQMSQHFFETRRATVTSTRRRCQRGSLRVRTLIHQICLQFLKTVRTTATSTRRRGLRGFPAD